MKKIFTIILLILCITNVKAYENDLFKINIPDNYKAEISDKIYKWTNDNKYIAVTISDNTNHYKFNRFSDEDLARQKEHIIETYKVQLEDYDCTVDVSDIKKDKINDNYFITYNLHWNSAKTIGYNMYQKIAVYSTENYIYTVTNSSDEDFSYEDFKSLLNTFDHNDYPTHSRLLSFILVFGIIGGIIGYFIKVKKNKKHK
jgi:hypothetical protein